MMFVKIALLVLQILHLIWTVLIVKSAAAKFTKGEVRYLMSFIKKIAGFFSFRKLCVALLLHAKCENYTADILSEAGPAYHSRAPMFNPVLFWWGSCFSSFQ